MVAHATVGGTPRVATVVLGAQLTDFSPGQYISVGDSSVNGQDIWQINAGGVNAGANPGEIELSITGLNPPLGTDLHTVGTGIPINSNIVPQPFVSLVKADAGTISVPASTVLIEEYALTLTLQDLTGRTDSAETITAGAIITSLDANEAGEIQIVGASDNGNIYQCIPLGDYCYIIKNRCIQAAQYVGRLSGTFFIRTEIRDEGLIGRNAWLRLNDNRLIFLGNRELYDYRGGSTLTPVCQQFTRQLLRELDRSKIHEVILHHKEMRNEVWVIYPVQGGQKVLIWNYVEDTASIDLYDNSAGGICAIGQSRWGTDPTWNDMGEILWNEMDPSITWDSLVGSGEELATVLGMGNGSFYIHGIGYTRDGLGYDCFAETMDHDFGDGDVWKYVDAVVISLQVNATDNVTRTLYVSVGGKTTTDGTITWTDPMAIEVQGAAQTPCKINTGGLGRYIRLRFSSEDAGVQWRISGYEIYARAGFTY